MATRNSSSRRSTGRSGTGTRTASRSGARARTPDAIALLRADHKLVSELFEQFEKTRSANRKRGIVEQICQELTVHAQIEEEIFYPAFKEALRDKELVPEARVEHETLKSLIAQVQGAEPDGEEYDAKVKVMGEYVKHHVKEEQGEMFKKAKASRLDLQALGEQLMQRKQELMGELGGEETGELATEDMGQSDDR
ncbi:hemerythrin domain-containing protein [Ideonella sp.]|uniref:hemerythrin domain-containing protein n=1 Tax=Ideonella sp. TaxID=1929293 RepID=UPI0035B06B34